MTLEEFISGFEDISLDTLDAIGYTITEMQQVADYLRELKDLRVELEKNSKELEVYKKYINEIAVVCGSLKTNFLKNCIIVELLRGLQKELEVRDTNG